MLTLDDLYEEANRFLWDNYKMTLQIPIDIEEDFVTEEGAYEFTTYSPKRILIAEFIMTFADDEVVYDVLRHELVHHALHVWGLPFADGSQYFEAELKRLGIAPTLSTMVGRYHIYECACCGGEIPHYEKVEVEESKLVTVCCEAKFIDKKIQAVFTGKGRIY